jgi:hypothetical protein
MSSALSQFGLLNFLSMAVVGNFIKIFVQVSEVLHLFKIEFLPLLFVIVN